MFGIVRRPEGGGGGASTSWRNAQTRNVTANLIWQSTQTFYSLFYIDDGSSLQAMRHWLERIRPAVDGDRISDSALCAGPSLPPSTASLWPSTALSCSSATPLMTLPQTSSLFWPSIRARPPCILLLRSVGTAAEYERLSHASTWHFD